MSSITRIRRQETTAEQNRHYIVSRLGVSERRAERLLWTIDHVGGFITTGEMTCVQLLAAATMVQAAFVADRAPAMMVPDDLVGA